MKIVFDGRLELLTGYILVPKLRKFDYILWPFYRSPSFDLEFVREGQGLERNRYRIRDSRGPIDHTYVILVGTDFLSHKTLPRMPS